MGTNRVRTGRRTGAVVLATGALLALAVGPTFAHANVTSAGIARHALLAAEMVGAEPDEIAELDQLDGGAQGTVDQVDPTDAPDPTVAADPTDTPDPTETADPAKAPEPTEAADQGDQNDQGGDQAGETDKSGDQTGSHDSGGDSGGDHSGSGDSGGDSGGDSSGGGDSGSSGG